METKERMSPREWFENIWYHYKWVIIIGGVVILFLIVSLGQLFSNSEPDVNILHVGPMYISVDAAEEIEKTVATLSDDYNGDGEINTYLLDITINKVSDDASDPAVQQYNSEGYTRFQTEIRAGDDERLRLLPVADELPVHLLLARKHPFLICGWILVGVFYLVFNRRTSSVSFWFVLDFLRGGKLPREVLVHLHFCLQLIPSVRRKVLSSPSCPPQARRESS